MGEPTLFPSILNLLATAAFRALRFCLFRESPWAVIPRVLSLPQIILEFTVMFISSCVVQSYLELFEKLRYITIFLRQQNAMIIIQLVSFSL